jgi:hypothetical protein
VSVDNVFQHSDATSLSIKSGNLRSRIKSESNDKNNDQEKKMRRISRFSFQAQDSNKGLQMENRQENCNVNNDTMQSAMKIYNKN